MLPQENNMDEKSQGKGGEKKTNASRTTTEDKNGKLKSNLFSSCNFILKFVLVPFLMGMKYILKAHPQAGRHVPRDTPPPRLLKSASFRRRTLATRMTSLRTNQRRTRTATLTPSRLRSRSFQSFPPCIRLPSHFHQSPTLAVF